MRFALILLFVLGCGNVKGDSDAAVADGAAGDGAPMIDASTGPGPCVLDSAQLDTCTL
jgi:hypothetical protein